MSKTNNEILPIIETALVDHGARRCECGRLYSCREHAEGYGPKFTASVFRPIGGP